MPGYYEDLLEQTQDFDKWPDFPWIRLKQLIGTRDHLRNKLRYLRIVINEWTEAHNPEADIEFMVFEDESVAYELDGVQQEMMHIRLEFGPITT